MKSHMLVIPLKRRNAQIAPSADLRYTAGTRNYSRYEKNEIYGIKFRKARRLDRARGRGLPPPKKASALAAEQRSLQRKRKRTTEENREFVR